MTTATLMAASKQEQRRQLRRPIGDKSAQQGWSKLGCRDCCFQRPHAKPIGATRHIAGTAQDQRCIPLLRQASMRAWLGLGSLKSIFNLRPLGCPSGASTNQAQKQFKTHGFPNFFGSLRGAPLPPVFRLFGRKRALTLSVS